MQLIDIINRTRVLYNLNPGDLPGDQFPGGGGGSSSGGGGVTSNNVVPGLFLSPSTDQSIALGTTLCFTASGAISLPQESERNAVLDLGCSASSNGTWVKNCGTNGIFDAEAYSSILLHKKQPFQFTATNSSMASPGPPSNNVDLFMGIKTTGGYMFYFEVMRYCNTTPGNCSNVWQGYIKAVTPDGTQITYVGGLVEFNQKFRLRSDGTTLSWDYTTHNNWVYNRYYITLPEDVGKIQFFVNAKFLNNSWTNLKTYKGSYQGTIPPEDFIWNTNCDDNLVIDGSEACYTPTSSGSCQVCVSTEDIDDRKCVSVIASPLFINPQGIDCDGCLGNLEDCANVPNPTTPELTVDYYTEDSISLSWTESLSFAPGLYYEINVNGDIQTVLDTDVILIGLSPDVYTILVRAIDVCGNSDWSVEQIVDLSSIPIGVPDIPQNFLLEDIGNSVYEGSWDSVLGAVSYEIWAGNPQMSLVLSTSSTNTIIGTLPSGIYLSVRAKNGSDVYSDFSNFQQT